MAEVTVTINGRLYRMACGEGEEQHLIALAKGIDTRMEQLKGGFGEIGDMRLLLMASLTIADELAEAQKNLRGLEAEVASLKDARGAISERLHSAQESIANTIINAAERIEALNAQIAEAAPSSTKTEAPQIPAGE